MAIYSTTLIIKHKTGKSDAELLKSLNLHKKTTHAIGEENKSYHEALSGDSKSIYITSTEDFVVIVGMPLIMDLAYINRYNSFFPDSEFFFMFNESVSMLNGFVSGKGETIYRRKYVQDGKYFKAYDINPDFGTPLKEEEAYFDFTKLSEGKSQQKDDYLYGVNDYDISLKFLSNNFMENPAGFLEKLVFNRNISNEIAEYIKDSNDKVERKDIDNLFSEKFKSLAKELNLKKINFKGGDGKIPKDSFYRQFDGFKIHIVSIKQLSILPTIYYFSIELEKNDKWIQCLVNPYYFGIPVISFKPNVYLKLNEKGNDSIYTKNDLDLVAEDFENELVVLRKVISFLELKKPEELFSDEYFYTYYIDKIAKNVKMLGEIWNKDEINFCLLHYHFTKNKAKARDLIKLLDRELNEKNKSNKHQVLSRKAIADL